MKNSEKRIFFKIYSALIFKQGSSKIYPLIIYPEKIDSKNIFSKRRRNRENRSKRALRRTESSRNLTTWRIVERPQPPRIFPSLHSDPVAFT